MREEREFKFKDAFLRYDQKKKPPQKWHVGNYNPIAPRARSFFIFYLEYIQINFGKYVREVVRRKSEELFIAL